MAYVEGYGAARYLTDGLEAISAHAASLASPDRHWANLRESWNKLFWLYRHLPIPHSSWQSRTTRDRSSAVLSVLPRKLREPYRIFWLSNTHIRCFPARVAHKSAA